MQLASFRFLMQMLVLENFNNKCRKEYETLSGLSF